MVNNSQFEAKDHISDILGNDRGGFYDNSSQPDKYWGSEILKQRRLKKNMGLDILTFYKIKLCYIKPFGFGERLIRIMSNLTHFIWLINLINYSGNMFKHE